MTTYATVTWRKARRSGGNGNCVEVAAWRKATRSGGDGNCLEVTADGTAILIRDSKYLRDPDNDAALQPIMSVSIAQWQTFLSVAAGRSAEATEPRITIHADGSATLTAADGLTLDYTQPEWEAFSLGAMDGEFDDLADLWPSASLATA
ncbi:DUF397 domain-containing protein [Nocardia sp. NBC_01388]|uniref:DUF397 domain-containing protein n=1 Tax=Nocardia sp. NBC_01388 TaxID=2903596 RepID=UPI002F91A64B